MENAMMVLGGAWLALVVVWCWLRWRLHRLSGRIVQLERQYLERSRELERLCEGVGEAELQDLLAPDGGGR